MADDSASSSARSPLDAFLEAFTKDLEAKTPRPLAEYLARFPGDEVPIAREYVAVLGRDPTTRAPDPERHAYVGAPSERTIGPFLIHEEIGRGAQGVVYHATDTRLGRRVALKVLEALGKAPEDVLARFHREATAAAKLDHPAICTVYEAGVVDRIPFIAMRLIEGQSLAKKISTTAETVAGSPPSCIELSVAETDKEPQVPFSSTRQPPPATRGDLRTVVRFFAKAARGLHAAHEAGIIHRDIKPGNIMVATDGEPVIMDFGLAHIEDDDASVLTRTGDLFGTPVYMSPEQLTRQTIRLDRRTDIWSLGVTLYECLTLRRPFDAPTRQALYQTILTKEPPDPRRLNRGIPKDLAAIIETALQKDLDLRYQTAAAISDDLDAFLAGKPVAARRVGPAGRLVRWCRREPAKAALVAVLLLLVPAIAGLGGAWFARRHDLERVDREKRQEKIDAIVERGFLDLELRPERAIDTFRQALEIERRTPEAVAGAVFAYLRKGDAAGALAVIDAHADTQGRTTSDRLRAAVLRSDEETAKSNALLASLPAPSTALEHFLIALAEVDRGHAGDHVGYEAARDHLFRATVMSPKPLYVFELAHIAGHLADPKLSQAVKDVIASSWPDSPVAWHWVGNALETVDVDGAIAAYEQSIQLCGTKDDSWPEKSLRASALAGIAEARLSRGDFEHAMQDYRRLIETVPTYAPAYVSLAYALKAAGDEEGTLKTLRDAIAKWPGTALLHAELGARLFDFGHLPEAIAPFKKSLELNPKQPFLWSALTFTLLRTGKWKDAAETAKRGAQVQSESAEVQIALGCALVMAGDYPGGLSAIKRMFQLDARVLHRYPHIHRIIEALSTIERMAVFGKVMAVVRVDPDYAPCHVAVGICKRAAGKLDDAIKEFAKAVELDPTLEWAQFNLGTALLEKKDWSTALTALRRAVRISPAFSENWLYLGHGIRASGDLWGAIDAYEHVLAVEPDDFDARVALAMTLADANEPKLARHATDDLVMHSPTNPHAWNTLARFVSGPNARPEILDPPAGLAAARKAVEISRRTDPLILDSLAWARFRNADVEGAIATAQEALKLARDSKDVDQRILDRLQASFSRFEAGDTRPAPELR